LAADRQERSGARRGGTSYDVARAAGVSQSAVSRCFRPGTSVAPGTRARIIAAADALGYHPNAIAQSLITRRSNLVAVIISNLTNLYYPEVLAELTQQLSERGARVLLFALRSESEIDSVLDLVWRYQVDGAIVAAQLSTEQMLAFAARGTPLVLYNRHSTTVPVASVSCDFGAGSALIAGMVAAGCRAFGLIGGPPDSAVGEARVEGARAELARAGIAPVAVDRGDFSYESGHAAAHRLFAAYHLDAIVAANDVMALGAMDAARIDLAIRIPDDLSVVGFDGVAPAKWRSYLLTTIRQPVRRMTAAATAMLFERIENLDLGPERRFFPGDLIRGATARLG